MPSTSAQSLATAHVALTITVLFDNGNAALAACEAAVLMGWVKTWAPLTHKYRVHIGGAHETPRIGRLRRLTGIKDLLAQHGVDRFRILPDSDWTKPSRLGTVEELPSDLVWLELECLTRE